jgi:penicillin-binding protein 2
MGIETMNKYCKAYGLGEYTGIELAEKKGILAGPDYREQNGLEMWTPGNTISAAIGQSDNTFTPLQIASYVATVLNGGDRYSAHLLLKVCKYGSGDIVYLNDGEILSRAKLSGDAVAAVKEGMRQMVESSYTVSHNMRNVPVTVGGKTGTAELGGSTTENGLFVCAAPYNDPEIVVSAVIEHAGGGSYASYAAAQVLEEYYN